LRFFEFFAAGFGITRFYEDFWPQISQMARMQKDPSQLVFIWVIREIGGCSWFGCGLAALRFLSCLAGLIPRSRHKPQMNHWALPG